MNLNFYKSVIVFFIFSFFQDLRAQEVTELKKNSYITFNLLTPTISYVPRYNLGYYKKISERLVLGSEIGFGNYNSSFGLGKSYVISRNNQVFEIKPELMFILNKKRNTKMFVSTDFSYINHKEIFKNDNFQDLNDSKYYSYDSANYLREKFTFNLNYGMIIHFGNRFGIIPKVGLGYRIRNVKFTNIVNKREDMPSDATDGFDFYSSGYNDTKGNVSGFNFSLDAKIFYKI